jgi:amino acid transporter
MLPFSGFLRRVNPRTQTPIIALLVFAVIDVGVMIYGYFQTSAFLTLVGATSIIPYIIYFLITVGYAYKRRTLDSVPGTFSLGRWAWPVIIFVLLYTVLIMFILSVPAPFHGSDKFVLYGFGLALLWYVAALYWRLRRGAAGVKPIIDLVDPEPGETGPPGATGRS